MHCTSRPFSHENTFLNSVPCCRHAGRAGRGTVLQGRAEGQPWALACVCACLRTKHTRTLVRTPVHKSVCCRGSAPCRVCAQQSLAGARTLPFTHPSCKAALIWQVRPHSLHLASPVLHNPLCLACPTHSTMSLLPYTSHAHVPAAAGHSPCPALHSPTDAPPAAAPPPLPTPAAASPSGRLNLGAPTPCR